MTSTAGTLNESSVQLSGGTLNEYSPCAVVQWMLFSVPVQHLQVSAPASSQWIYEAWGVLFRRVTQTHRCWITQTQMPWVTQTQTFNNIVVQNAIRCRRKCDQMSEIETVLISVIVLWLYCTRGSGCTHEPFNTATRYRVSDRVSHARSEWAMLAEMWINSGARWWRCVGYTNWTGKKKSPEQLKLIVDPILYTSEEIFWLISSDQH